jgi:hypothetical protein
MPVKPVDRLDRRQLWRMLRMLEDAAAGRISSTQLEGHMLNLRRLVTAFAGPEPTPRPRRRR